MDSSKSSKPRKGIRRLMGKLSVSQSQSQSRARPRSPRTSQQTDLIIDEGSVPLSAGSGVVTVVEPTGGDIVLSQQDTEHQSISPRTSVSETRVRVLPSETGRRTDSVSWTALRTSLRYFHESSSVFPVLSSAIGVLLSCIDGLEAVAKNREDYEELATTLCTMSDALKQFSGSMLPSDSVSNLALSIERQAVEIQKKLAHMEVENFRDASTSEDELLRHYRRIQMLFQQLQINANINTWSMMSEQSVNSRLEALNPVKQAIYDSSLSTEVSRRGCTEGTRTAVLAGLDNWLLDPTSASIYWMNGMAGTGKTTIAYTFYEQVDRRKRLAASFFCTRNAVDCRKTSQIVPTIAYQLARTRVVSSGASIQVWRISDGSVIAKFAANLVIRSLAVSLDGTQLASGSDDRTIRLWKFDDGTLLAGPFSASNSLAPNLFNLVTPLKYTPEGTRPLARTSDGTITVWPVQEILLKSFTYRRFMWYSASAKADAIPW